MVREIMKWKVEADDWFTLELLGVVRFQEFLKDILDRKDNSGKVEIQLLRDNSYVTLTYERGTITWKSDDIIDHLGEAVVVSARAHGFPQRINYYISVRR